MLNRFWTVLVLVPALAGGMLLIPKTAVAQDQPQTYYTYVSEWAVPRAQWAAFDKQQESGNAMMQKFVADGTLVAWGNDEVRVHQEDGITHDNWMVATSRANLLKALEFDWTTATNPSYAAVTKHFDIFLHTIAHGGKTSSGTTGYIRVGTWQARPGQEDAFSAYVMKNLKPLLDADVANGTILMYNIDEEDIHTSAPGAYDIAVVYPNGAAIDKFFDDVAAAEKGNPELAMVLDSLTVGKDHRDSLGRVVAYQHK